MSGQLRTIADFDGSDVLAHVLEMVKNKRREIWVAEEHWHAR